MKRGTPGRRVTFPYSGSDVDSVVPWPLHPKPPLSLTTDQAAGLDQAMLALGRLSGLVNSVGRLPPRLQELFVWREALMAMSVAKLPLSLEDLIMYEAGYPPPGVPEQKVATARRAISAHERGLARLKTTGAVDSALMRELHLTLTGEPRRNKYGVSSHLGRPGAYRHTLLWTGNLRRTNWPNLRSPPARVPALMRNLDDFLADRGPGSGNQALTKAAIVHAQIELVYPFADDACRTNLHFTGLLLRSLALTSRPAFQLSEPLVRYRLDYLQALDLVLYEGNWENWTHFFSWWILNAAERSAALISRVTTLRAEHMALIADLKRSKPSVAAVFTTLAGDLVTTPKRLVANSGITKTPVYKALAILEEMGIARELTGFARYRLYRYEPLIRAFASGTGLPAPGPARAPRTYEAPRYV